jgi:uncharacterized damage-inducible protein DinB
MLAELLDFLAYNRWAHERTLAASARVSKDDYERTVGGSFPSLRATLEHLFLAEAIWVSRWHGDAAGQVPDIAGVDSPAALRERWIALWKEQWGFFGDLKEEDMTRRIAVRTRSGITAEPSLGDTIRHLVNHGSYHRGQAATLIRRLGSEPLATDYFLYCLERDSARVVTPTLFTPAVTA